MQPLVLGTWVSSVEEPAMAAAAEQLGEALQDGAGPPWPVTTIRLPDNGSAIPPDTLVIGSMLADVDRLDRPTAAIADRWAARIAQFGSAHSSRFHLCTIFRAAMPSRSQPALLERIRRLNLLAVELSRATGVAVIDIDRSLSFFGAELLQSDHSLRGRRAAEAAGHAIAAALLQSDLCGLVPPARQAAASQRHGRLFQMGTVVDKRLARASTQTREDA